jgi:hypothetical protein
MTKPRRKSTDQYLGLLREMTPRRAEKFLCTLANLKLQADAIAKLHRDYMEVLPGDFDAATTARLRRQLQRAWVAPDLRQREWFLHELESHYHKLRGVRELRKNIADPVWEQAVLGEDLRPDSPIFELQLMEPPAEPSALEAIVLYFKRNAERARYCPNADCPAPYFFATNKNQKFCSTECAKPAQRDNKLRWWNENRAKA